MRLLPCHCIEKSESLIRRKGEQLRVLSKDAGSSSLSTEKDQGSKVIECTYKNEFGAISHTLFGK
jgi:hypothetical protein